MTHGTSSRRPLFDVDAALANPSAYFAEPGEILAHPALALDVQRKLLHQWEQDARQLAEAETEGMEGGEPNMLRRVREAISTLEERGEAAARDAPSTIRQRRRAPSPAACRMPRAGCARAPPIRATAWARCAR